MITKYKCPFCGYKFGWAWEQGYPERVIKRCDGCKEWLLLPFAIRGMSYAIIDND